MSTAKKVISAIITELEKRYTKRDLVSEGFAFASQYKKENKETWQDDLTEYISTCDFNDFDRGIVKLLQKQ